MADDLQSWFKSLPKKLQQELAGTMLNIADGLADDIRTAAEEHSLSGETAESVRVTPGRDATENFVEAGGPATTENGYDRALAQEFGTQKMPAQPFFYSTYYARRQDIRQAIERAVTDVLSKT